MVQKKCRPLLGWLLMWECALLTGGGLSKGSPLWKGSITCPAWSHIQLVALLKLRACNSQLSFNSTVLLLWCSYSSWKLTLVFFFKRWTIWNGQIKGLQLPDNTTCSCIFCVVKYLFTLCCLIGESTYIMLGISLSSCVSGRVTVWWFRFYLLSAVWY